jgi:hypothetical protein
MVIALLITPAMPHWIAEKGALIAAGVEVAHPVRRPCPAPFLRRALVSIVLGFRFGQVVVFWVAPESSNFTAPINFLAGESFTSGNGLGDAEF